MDISQSALAWLYLYALLLGIGLGAFYDVFRITRVFLGVHYSRHAARYLQEIRLPFLTAHKRRMESHALGIVVFLEDLIFCILSAVALILLFYEANNGKFRFPVLICVGAGFLLYRGTLGRFAMLFSEVIAFAIETAVRYVCFFLFLPIRFLGRWVFGKSKQVCRSVALANRRTLRRRFTAIEYGRVARDACGMVPKTTVGKTVGKRGKLLGKGTKKTIQSHAVNPGASRRFGGGFHRNICK